MNDIQACLNCKASFCSGDYPNCEGAKPKKRKPYRRTKLRSLGRGNATVLVCLLAKLGYSTVEIGEICDAATTSVVTLLNVGVKNALITEEDAQSAKTKVYPKKKPA